jgi:hypothetical protein
MVTAADYRSLEEAANRYLSDQDFGVPEVEAVMSKVFGESRTGIEATAWAHYWRDLNIYKENLRDNMSDAGMAPKVSQPCFPCYFKFLVKIYIICVDARQIGDSSIGRAGLNGNQY